MSRWLDRSGPWFVGQFNLCWVCLRGEVLVLFSAYRGSPAWRICVLILSAWFAFGAGLCGGILTHLPVGLAYGTSLYWFCL